MYIAKGVVARGLLVASIQILSLKMDFETQVYKFLVASALKDSTFGTLVMYGGDSLALRRFKVQISLTTSGILIGHE